MLYAEETRRKDGAIGTPAGTEEAFRSSSGRLYAL